MLLPPSSLSQPRARWRSIFPTVRRKVEEAINAIVDRLARRLRSKAQ
jgi:hypothetical protein